MNIENRELSQKLVDTIEFLKQSISKISVYDLNYYSMSELYYNIAKKINELIEMYHEFGVSISEEIIKQNECLHYLLNDGLIKEVVNKINQMVTDGTMDTIINHNIFNELNSKIKEIENCTKIILKSNNNIPSSINNAINKLTNNANSVIDFNKFNGVIELEAGIYEVDTIIMKSNITIKGQGIGKTILKPVFSDINKYIFDVDRTDTNNRLVNFELKDLSIMPSPNFQYSIEGEDGRYLASGINFTYCSSCRLTNVIISGFKGTAINQVENYDCNIDNFQMLGCGNSSHNAMTFLNGTSDGCNAIHINGFRFEGNSNILIECTDAKFQREIQFGIGKFENTGIIIKGSSNINFIGCHFTWSKANAYLISLNTSPSTEIYGIKMVGCSFLGINSYLCNNTSDGYIRFSNCNIKGFNKTFEGNKIDVTDNEIYSCLSPIFNITSENKIVNNKILATRGNDYIIILNGNNNIISLNENIASITTKGCNVLGDFNEILFNKGFNAKIEGKINWDASNNYQTTNGIRATYTPSEYRGALKFDVNTKKVSFYNGTSWVNTFDMNNQCSWVAPVNTNDVGDVISQFNALIAQLVTCGLMKSN